MMLFVQSGRKTLRKSMENTKIEHSKTNEVVFSTYLHLFIHNSFQELRYSEIFSRDVKNYIPLRSTYDTYGFTLTRVYDSLLKIGYHSFRLTLYIYVYRYTKACLYLYKYI